ncbi:MAG TPA: hypothetical protein VIL09_07550 [Microvirga sp.]|jgi:hypothetical protein
MSNPVGGHRTAISSILPILLLLTTVAAGYKIAQGALTTSHWLAPTNVQILYVLGASALLLIASSLAGWRLGRNPGVILAIAIVPVVASLSGLSAFVSVTAFLAGAFLVGMSVWMGEASDESPPASLIIGLGLALIAVVLTIAARFPINNPTFYTLLTLSPVAALALQKVRSGCLRQIQAVQRTLSHQQPKDVVYLLGTYALLVVLAVQLLHSLLPERYHDAMAVHLYIASFMLSQGRWSFDVSTAVYAHMPLTIDFIYAHLFALGGEKAVKLFNFSILVLICSLLYDVVKRYAGGRAALWTVVLFASMPLTLIETASLFVENTLTFWILCAGALLIMGWPRIPLRSACMVLLPLCAIVLSKLHGVVATAFLGPTLIAAFAGTRPNPAAWGRFVLASVLAAVVGSLPYAHAWLATGNPIFPFFNNIFQSPLWPPVAFADAFGIRSSWTLLWDATFSSTKYLEAWDGALGLTLLIFLPMAVLAAGLGQDSRMRLALFMGLGFIVVIATQTQYLRYFYPGIPLVMVAVGLAMHAAMKSSAGSALVLSVAAATVAMNVFLMPTAGWILRNPDFQAVFNEKARLALERNTVPERHLNAIVNVLAGRSARVLYTQRSYGALLQGLALPSNWYNTQFANEIATLQTADQAGRLIQRMAATHVIHPQKPTTPYELAMDAYLKGSAREVTRIGGFVLYTLSLGRAVP